MPACASGAAHMPTVACVAGGGKRVATEAPVVLKAVRREPGIEVVLCGDWSFQLVMGEV